MVGLTRAAPTWLTLQDQHVHGWPYKISTYMQVDLTRSARTWLTLQDHQRVHGWPYNACIIFSQFLLKSTSTTRAFKDFLFYVSKERL
jgi:hypothetical protein